MGVITLTTDFGLRDGYVGVMKGVMLGISPAATLVDITHEIAPQDIGAAAFVLYTSYRYFPPQTVHLVVVDPGVGTARRPIAVATAAGAFVAPDNGVLGYVLEAEGHFQAVHLTESPYWLPELSATFHGRDIFAPAAAHLSAGVPLERLGPVVHDPVRRPLPEVSRMDDGRLRAIILYVDRFGNAITNLAGDRFPGRGASVRALVNDHVVEGLVPTYGVADPHQPLLLVGSSGFVEIAVREGSAAAELGLQAGDPVLLEIGRGVPGV